MVAVELAHDVLTPALDVLAARQVHDRAAILHERGVQARDVEHRGRQVDEGDERVRAAHRRDAGDVGDERDVVDVVVHHRALVVEAMRARELTVVRAEEHRRVVQDAQLARHVHDASDLEVDHGRVTPVDRDELLPLLVRERGRGPVGRVVLLNRGLTDEGVAEVFRQLDVIGINEIEPLVGQEVGQMRPEEVHVEAEGLRRVLPVGRVLAQLLDRTVRQEALEGSFLGLVEARGDDVAVSSAGQLAAPQVVGAHGREVVGLEPGDVLFVGHRVFGAPVGVVVRAELVGQIVAAVVFADDADVVAGVTQFLRVRPRALGDRDLVGDVPLGVGQHLVLARALAGEQ